MSLRVYRDLSFSPSAATEAIPRKMISAAFISANLRESFGGRRVEGKWRFSAGLMEAIGVRFANNLLHLGGCGCSGVQGRQFADDK